MPCSGRFVDINAAIDAVSAEPATDNPPYITGWEYACGDLAEDLLSTIPAEILVFEDQHNVLKSYQIAQVMKWIFIGPEGSGSDFHVDPICADAWMVLLEGRKTWQIHGTDGVVYSGIQEPGDLIFVPSGALHAVKNLDFTIAVTHNFVDSTRLDELNDLMKKGLENEDFCDALLERLLVERVSDGFFFNIPGGGGGGGDDNHGVCGGSIVQ